MKLKIRCFVWFLVTMLISISGRINIEKLEPHEIAIMQYDSREPRDYWLSAAKWNNQYCKQHGHIFIYYTTKEGCHFGSEKLATPWCKVKAMLAANEDFPDVKLFVYMDSDAVIDKRFSDQSLNALLHIMQDKLSWRPEVKPIIFNQDGSCWWCKLVVSVGYKTCLNAGTVVWYRHERSLSVLRSWWTASMDPYETNPIKRKFRLKWPWEQDRQMAVFNRSSEYIQVASQPERVHMQARIGFNDWCLSHLPEAGCFISHYCANGHAKQMMKRIYSVDSSIGGGGSESTAVDENGVKEKSKEMTMEQKEEPTVDFDFAVQYLTFEDEQ